MSSFCGATDTLFWTFIDVSSGFQSQGGQPCSHMVEAYVIYVTSYLRFKVALNDKHKYDKALEDRK